MAGHLPTLTVAQATAAAESAGVTQPTVVQLTNQINHSKQIQVTVDLNSKPPAQRSAIENNVQDALAKAANTTPGQRQLQRRRSHLGWAGHLARPSRR